MVNNLTIKIYRKWIIIRKTLKYGGWQRFDA